jgi:hypothetical protein
MPTRQVTIHGVMTWEDPYPSQGPGFPTPPIYLPPPVWGGAPPPIPTHPIFYPPYPSQGPGFPTHPIAPGGPPLGIWGGAPIGPNPPYPDQGLPGQPPGIWPSPGQPTHPIYNPPYPSQGPGFPTHPIAPGGPPPQIWPSPGVPTHPIYYPPYPSQGPGFPTHPIAPGGPPPGIWPSPGHPSHPIYWPPFPSQGPGFPTHPIAPGGGAPPSQPGGPEGGINQPIAGVPGPGGQLVWYWSPVWGWIAKPAEGSPSPPEMPPAVPSEDS